MQYLHSQRLRSQRNQQPAETQPATQPAEIREWKWAYEDDQKSKPTMQQLRQGEAFEQYHLTPQVLLVVQRDDRQFLMVPLSLRQRIMRECHYVLIMGHVGIFMKMELVSWHYYQRGMKGDITSYMKTCPICQEVKSDNKAKAYLLQLLESPTRKWAWVTINLVTDLPESNGFTAIVVFVDRMMKMVHFAPCTKK